MSRALRTGAAVLFAGALSAQAPCFDPVFGADLALGDDQVARVTLTAFAFPFGGASVQSLGIASDGFVWLDPAVATPDPTPSEAELLALGPRICARWCDLYPPGAAPGGGVFFREVAAANGSPARAIVTWDRVPWFADRAQSVTMQLQLDATGAITVFYDSDPGPSGGGSIVGTSAGNGAAAAPRDLSALPFDTGASPTAYEAFDLGSAHPFDLATAHARWSPNGRGGLQAAATACARAEVTRYGQGCPRNLTAYEEFAPGAVDLAQRSFRFVATGTGYAVTAGTGLATGYANALAGVGDDTLHARLPLGFAFPFAGGAIQSVNLSSNGYLWLADVPTSDFTPSVAELCAQPPRIAALWRDLDCTGAQVFWDALPGVAMATFAQVRNFGGGSGTSTFQIRLYPNGDFELAYGALDPAAALIGLSEGNGAFDPGGLDLTAQLVGLRLGAAGVQPLGLEAAAGSVPRLGSTFTLLLRDAPAGTAVLAVVLGMTATPLGADLTPLGMPGCRQFAAIDASVFLPPLSGPLSLLPFAIPSWSGLVGAAVFAQGVGFDPSANAAGVVASNGAALRLGL